MQKWKQKQGPRQDDQRVPVTDKLANGTDELQETIAHLRDLVVNEEGYLAIIADLDIFDSLSAVIKYGILNDSMQKMIFHIVVQMADHAEVSVPRPISESDVEAELNIITRIKNKVTFDENRPRGRDIIRDLGRRGQSHTVVQKLRSHSQSQARGMKEGIIW